MRRKWIIREMRSRKKWTIMKRKSRFVPWVLKGTDNVYVQVQVTWRWRQYVPPKSWLPLARLQCVRAQKTTVEIFTAVKTSNHRVNGSACEDPKGDVTAYLNTNCAGIWRASSPEVTWPGRDWNWTQFRSTLMVIVTLLNYVFIYVLT
jgi:hypothetical protein